MARPRRISRDAGSTIARLGGRCFKNAVDEAALRCAWSANLIFGRGDRMHTVPMEKAGGREAGFVGPLIAPSRARFLALVGVLLAAGGVARLAVSFGPSAEEGPSGMVLIPGGEFAMGDATGDGMHWERPVHTVRVDDFFIDTFEVTNRQFQRFVAATGHATTAEKPAGLAEIMRQLPPGTPPPPPEKLSPSSLVFQPSARRVGIEQLGPPGQWAYIAGADWRHPMGPSDDIAGKDDFPVVQVSWHDAVAYCEWMNRRLPTEAEWERAARGGLERKRFAWGNRPFDPKAPQANIWHRALPHTATIVDGSAAIESVGRFMPNGYGLYDMAGNVWEWCSDWYRPDTYELAAKNGTDRNPRGPMQSFDPDEPYAPKRVIRGGSFLCSTTHCASFRPSARMRTSPDSATNHQGFRCATSKGAMP
jgi:formylglycine-generating enzyme